jgi:hypothetical protein
MAGNQQRRLEALERKAPAPRPDSLGRGPRFLVEWPDDNPPHYHADGEEVSVIVYRELVPLAKTIIRVLRDG